MRSRSFLTGLLLAAASAVGALVWGRRTTRRRERAELYFADGSLVTFSAGSPEADRLLGHARELLTTARG
jgi:hypothetical protein